MKIFELFVKAGLCSSNKEAKRLIQQGGAKINDVVINDIDLIVSHCDSKIIIGKWEDDKFIVHSCMLPKT